MELTDFQAWFFCPMKSFMSWKQVAPTLLTDDATRELVYMSWIPLPLANDIKDTKGLIIVIEPTIND